MNECEEVKLGCEEEKEKVAGKCRARGGFVCFYNERTLSFRNEVGRVGLENRNGLEEGSQRKDSW